MVSPELMEVDDVDSSPSLDLDEARKIEFDGQYNVSSKYQKQNVFMHLLPYADDLEKETEDLLDKTILNLAKAVLARDLTSGFSLYTKSLGSYIDMYGRKFTKEQHVKLIQLMVEILTMETIPLAIITDVAELLQTLLKKLHLLTREDLTISWRPLYQTLDRWVYHRKYSLSCNANGKLEAALKDTIRYCNLYFPKESAGEIIAEFSPMLCPATTKMNFGLEMLRYFLPFQNSECEEEICDFLKFLLSFHDGWNNHPVWEWSMMNLLSSAACLMPGKFNWDPYIPSVYARLMRNLDLPVYFKSGKSSASIVSCKTYECSSTARWIVATLGNNSTALNHLRAFIKSLETYFNPANAGRWTNTLATLLRELAENFTRRVKRERYLEKDRWWMKTPEDKKLTENDIDVFVDICTSLALNFYLDLVLGGYVLKSLVVLRPQIIIPAVMEKYSGMVETLTESKKYMTTMRWAMVLINMFISSRHEPDGYDGRHLVIPFLSSLVPAIDPNDMTKTLTALSCLCIAVSHMNVVDCSSLASVVEDETQREICYGTGGFDDFVVQLLDRVFALIENRAHENTRMADSRTVNTVNMEDISLQRIIWAVFRPLATHSSTTICEMAVEKIVSFALSNTLETDVSGRLFAAICQAFAVSRPDVILPKLLPRLCSSIEFLVTDDILDEEDLDKTLLFHMLLVSYMLESVGTELIKFRAEIERMLNAVMKLNGKKGYNLASVALTRLLNSLVFIYPLENKLADANFDDPNYLAIVDWGKNCHWRDTKIKWHTPTIQELEWANEIFTKEFTRFSKDLENVSKLHEASEAINKSLLKRMQILQSAYDGISVVLPFWNDTPIIPVDSVVDFSADVYTFGLPKYEITVPGTGENVKKKYFEILTEVQNYVERFKADDTDAFVAIIRGLDSLIVPCVESGNRYMVVSQKIKKLAAHIPEDVCSLDPKKRYTRFKTVIRTYGLHLKRVRAAAYSTWTESHLEVLHRLFSLCVNRYAKVRGIAQQRYCRYLDYSSGFLCRYVTSHVLDKLKEGVPHHEYKGALYVLQSTKLSPILINSWEELSRLWLALLRSPFSEKNSIILCMHNIQRIIARDFIFFPFEDKIPGTSKVNELAKQLLKDSQQNPSDENIPILDLSKNIYIFNKLIDGLLEFGPTSTSHWRKQLLSCEMLSVLVVREIPIREDVIEYFYQALVSQYIDIQRIGLAAVPWILSLFKRVYKAYSVDSRTGIKFEEGENVRSVLQYRSQPTRKKYSLCFSNNDADDLPHDLVIHKSHEGFTSLPNEVLLRVCPADFSDISDQSEGCQSVIRTTNRFLKNQDYLTKLLELWSIEDKTKGIGSKRTSFAKLVARNNGPESLTLLLELILPMSKDKDQWKQRCVSNVLGGLVYGMKLWSNEKIEKFWSKLKPILNDCLNNVTQETYDYWISAVCLPVNNRDGNKMRFFVQFLQERFVKSLETAQTTSVEAHNNMSFFELAMASLQWRGGDLFIEILQEVSRFFLDTPIPYRNVRGQLGRLLGNVYEWNIEPSLNLGIDLQKPCDEFLSEVVRTLKDVVPESAKFQASDMESEENLSARNLLLKFKTVLEWLNSMCWDLDSTIHSKFYCFIPWLCYFESYDPDPEISNLATITLSGLSKHLIRPEHMDTLLDALNETANTSSWKASLCVLEFLKVFAISNASIISSKEEWASRVVDIVLNLLAERKLEVRELASRILCGFLHCLLVPKPMDLLKKFQDDADQCMKRRKLAKSKTLVQFGPEHVDQAHSAILGICAFVDTHPYDVPDFLPDVLVFLSNHLNDCQPLPATIRKCLSNFRRTHHDNWASHKLKFSEDQLCILTDIFVSPCYYA